MWSLRVPDILLAIRAQDSTIVGNKVCRVVKQTGLVGSCMLLNDCSWNNADLQLFGESLVVGEVFAGLAGLFGPAGVVRDPAAQVVSGEETSVSVGNQHGSENTYSGRTASSAPSAAA